MFHVWNQWFSDVAMAREIATSSCNGENSTGNANRTSRRYSPSIIPSLFELASSSFKILKEFNPGSRLRTSLTDEFEDDTLSPLSTPSEVRFCNSVIAECKGPEGEVQRRCALNYKKWLSLRSTPCQLDCNGTTTTVS